MICDLDYLFVSLMSLRGHYFVVAMTIRCVAISTQIQSYPHYQHHDKWIT